MENELKQVIKFALFNTGAPFSFSSEDELIKELKQQTMLSVLGPKLNQLPFSDKNLKYCTKYTLTLYAYTHKLLYEQSLLIDLFKKNKIPMAILKGSAAAMNYPVPSYRTLGDVDFIVQESDFLKAYELMLANGYQLCYDEDHTDYHYTLGKDNIMFELHKHPAGLPEGESGEYLMNFINKGLEDTKTTVIEKYEIPVLPTIPNGIVLLLHIRKHLHGGLGLRQIADWMMFVDKHLDDQAWENDYQIILTKSGLDVLAKTVTRMCQIHLGLSDDITWCNDASAKLCDELWQYVLEKGNFGKKEGAESKGKNVEIHHIKSPVALIKKLQNDGLKKWNVFQKYKLLKPFAWIRQLVYYITYVFKHRKHIIDDVKTGKTRAKMIDKLIEKH